MATKCTMIFTLTTNISDEDSPNHRTGGWSETWYDQDRPIDQTVTFFNTLCTLRAALLPKGAAIKGRRFQKVMPTGASQSDRAVFPGGTLQCDVPQMALFCIARGLGVRNTRKFELRGIPDARVVEGEYSPSAAYRDALNAYFRNLGTWYWPAQNLEILSWDVVSITNAGLVTTIQNHGYGVGDVVTVLRTKNQLFRKVGGTFKITTVPTPTTFTLRGWDKGDTFEGKVRRQDIQLMQVDAAADFGPTVVVRKVGRAPFPYRGRQSRRR